MAVSRLMLDNFPHIKAYWVMLGIKTAQVALSYGADDIDGTVVHEKIYHDAGRDSPQEMTRGRDLRRLIEEAGRVPVERDTLYHEVIREGGRWKTGRKLASRRLTRPVWPPRPGGRMGLPPPGTAMPRDDEDDYDDRPRKRRRRAPRGAVPRVRVGVPAVGAVAVVSRHRRDDVLQGRGLRGLRPPLRRQEAARQPGHPEAEPGHRHQRRRAARHRAGDRLPGRVGHVPS